MHRTTTIIASAVVVAAIASVPLADAPTPAAAAVSARQAAPTSDFSAEVRAIRHGPGSITLTGTAEAGGAVELGGDVLAPVRVEAGTDGTWTAEVRVRVGRHVVRVTSVASGEAVDVPVEVLVLSAPTMLSVVDGIARTITLDGTGHPGAHIVLREGGRDLAETDVDDDGTWRLVLHDLSFGDHHLEAWQYFDGAHNGGVDDVLRVSGAPEVTAGTASRETDRIVLAGRAPAGSLLSFADRGGPVLGSDGDPLRVTTGADTRWTASLPIRADARFETITVTSRLGDDELGSATARVTVPVRLTGTVEERADGDVRLSGSGEPGAEVALETESGAPVERGGAPVTTTIGRGWQLVVPRDVLPADVVVVRQRVAGVGQGSVRLVLPVLPGTPGGGGDGGTGAGGGGGAGAGGGGTGAGGPGAGTGDGTAVGSTVLPGASSGQTGTGPVRGAHRGRSTERLAATGADLVAPAATAAVLLATGAAVLAVGARRRRSRPAAD